MSRLYEEIRGECSERGLGSGDPPDDPQCIYARVYACSEAQCPLVAQFCGKRPADMLVERFNLKAQFERDMSQEGVGDLSEYYADSEGM
jgi:hypothetical protein